jgi:hypothetical protein
MADQVIGDLAVVIGTRAACAAVGRSRATYYRRHRKSPAPPRPRRVRAPQPRALSGAERVEVLSVLHHERFVDQAPASIYANLLDEGPPAFVSLASRGFDRFLRSPVRHMLSRKDLLHGKKVGQSQVLTAADSWRPRRCLVPLPRGVSRRWWGEGRARGATVAAHLKRGAQDGRPADRARW